MQLFASQSPIRSLFLLFSALPLISAAPASNSSTSSLEARKLTPELAAFNEKINAAQLVIYPDQEDYMDFTTPGYKSLASDAFGGGIGAVIVSRKGAIAGHYTMNTASMKQAKTKLQKLYKTHAKDLQGAVALVYVQVKTAKTHQYVNKDLTLQFIGIVKEIAGKEPQVLTYIEALDVWYDKNGMPLSSQPDLENLRTGALLIESSGGGNSRPALTFLDIETIKESGEPIV
ncbi:hypothetical protein M426DRAFT_264488 [Hypoxylon sp. CI-4A]|nr:hypothetical protein M426DRAFT_264488 [Hypoxylon sp. CI-4A]